MKDERYVQRFPFPKTKFSGTLLHEFCLNVEQCHTPENVQFFTFDISDGTH
jgi:hypothetical protein